MTFFIFLFLFIFPYSYGAANSLTNQPEKTILLFLPVNDESKKLIEDFKTVEHMPFVIKNFNSSFSLEESQDQATRLRNDFNKRLNVITSKALKFSQLLQRLNKHKNDNFRCIKVKPIEKGKTIRNIPLSVEKYQDYLGSHIEVVDVKPETVNAPKTKVDLLKSYLAQNNIIDTQKKQFNQLQQEKNSVDVSVNLLNEKVNSLEQEKIVFEEKLEVQQKNADRQVVELKQQLDAANREKNELKQSYLDDINQLKNELTKKDALANFFKEQVEIVNTEKELFKKQCLMREKAFDAGLFEEDKLKKQLLIKEEELQLLMERLSQIQEKLKDMEKNYVAANPELTVQKKEIVKRTKILTVLASLIGILAYNRQALKNIDLQSCLRWVEKNSLRFSDFVQLQYLLARAYFRL